jgi:hypothetical protein
VLEGAVEGCSEPSAVGYVDNCPLEAVAVVAKGLVNGSLEEDTPGFCGTGRVAREVCWSPFPGAAGLSEVAVTV